MSSETLTHTFSTDDRYADSPPSELVPLRQFVAWQYQDGQKVPINPHTGYKASHSNPATWGTLDDAIMRAVADSLDGIGFVFSPDDPFAGYDLDDCRDPQTGVIQEWAWKIIRAMNSYAEVSPSGTGIKGLIRGQLPGRGRARYLDGHKVEV